MHEFSTAISIVETVLESSRDLGALNVQSVELEIGALTFLNPEQLQFWIEEGFKKTLADGAHLKVKIIEPRIHCEECDYKGGFKVAQDPMFHLLLPVFSCPSCGSTKIVLRKGKECRIRKIQILKEESDET